MARRLADNKTVLHVNDDQIKKVFDEHDIHHNGRENDRCQVTTSSTPHKICLMHLLEYFRFYLCK